MMHSFFNSTLVITALSLPVLSWLVEATVVGDQEAAQGRRLISICKLINTTVVYSVLISI